MHALMVRVLEGRQLNSAGQLFAISDYDVITDLHTTFARIKAIFNAPGYVDSHVDKEVVAIVITRITAAIRTTCSMETYSAEMVDVLDSALRHPMSVIDRDSGEIIDSPHCKIATELISSLFLHYSKKSVMTLAIPVALQALATGHADLVRSTTSYLSLAAIYNARALAQYTLQIINFIIQGNCSLCRVLPQIYSENREPVHVHLPQLLRLLDVAEAADRLSLIMLASIVANHKPDLLLPFLTPLTGHLNSNHTCTAVLHILNALVAQNRVAELVDVLPLLCTAIEKDDLSSNHATLAKLIAGISRKSLSLSVYAMPRLVDCAVKCSQVPATAYPRKEDSGAENLPIVLSQIEVISEAFPQTLAPHMQTLRSLARIPGIGYQVDRILSHAGIVNDEDVTIISIRSANFDSSLKDASSDSLSLLSKRSASRPPHGSSGYVTASPPCSGTRLGTVSSGIGTVCSGMERGTISSGIGTMSAADASALELDKNLLNLANQYQNRSSSSLSKQWSRSNGSMLQNFTRTGSDAVPHTAGGAPAGSAGSRGALSSASVASSSSGMPRGVPIHMLKPPSSSYGGPPPKTQTLPSNFNPQATSTPLNERAGYRPIPSSWTTPAGATTTALYETTFPAGSGPVTTKMAGVAIVEEDENSHIHEDEDDDRREASTSEWQNDVVWQFVDHRRAKIRQFVQNARAPIPIQCTVERGRTTSLLSEAIQIITGGGKHHLRVHFACQQRATHCIFRDDFLFVVKTKNPATWLHLMFLQMQATSMAVSGVVQSQSSPQYAKLAHCWTCLPHAITKVKPFSTLVTSAFPSSKEQDKLLKELDEANFFDCFSLEGNGAWCCFSCAHPEKVRNFVEERTMEGALKEKKGKWKFLRRWQTKYFTLSPGTLTYSTKKHNSEAHSMLLPAIDLKKIRSVRSLGRGKKGRKSLRKAFEIFTSDQTSYILKAADERKAEEWMQCLQLAVAQAKREAN